jgi:hypothetical protein
MVHETHQETSGAMEMVHETHQETSGAMEEEQLKRTTETSQMVIKKHHRWLSRNITDGYQETSGAMEEEPRKQTLETSQMVRETHQETSGALEEEQHKQTLETPNVSCERPSEATEANSKKLYDCPLKTKSAFFGSVIDETYQEEHVRRLPIQRAIALRSPCGTGKTKATHELLKELSEKTSISVVWVVHRKAVQRGAAETAMLRRQ